MTSKIELPDNKKRITIVSSFDLTLENNDTAKGKVGETGVKAINIAPDSIKVQFDDDMILVYPMHRVMHFSFKTKEEVVDKTPEEMAQEEAIKRYNETTESEASNPSA